MKNILIVDNDLGFIIWLGEVLVGAKYQPWPACSVADAISVTDGKSLVPLDLLIVNPSLPDASGLITRFRRRRAHLKVIALGAHDERVLAGVDAWREKPDPGNPQAQQWVKTVGRVLSGHKRAA